MRIDSVRSVVMIGRLCGEGLAAYSEVGVQLHEGTLLQLFRREVPKGHILPEQNLFNAIPLFDFGEGFVPAQIGDGFIRERD
jgi:hypothetical protein